MALSTKRRQLFFERVDVFDLQSLVGDKEEIVGPREEGGDVLSELDTFLSHAVSFTDASRMSTFTPGVMVALSVMD